MKRASATQDGPCLLPGATRPATWLVLVLLVVSFMAGLELVAATVAVRAAAAWSPRLAGSVTIAVGGGGLESAEAAAARASEILAYTPGVAKVSVLDPDPADAAAARLMGLRVTPGGDPPRLLSATFPSGNGVSAGAIRQALDRERLVAAVDDHGAWTGPLERTAIIAALGAAGVLLALFALAWAATAASAQGAVRRQRDRVRLLLHLGATDPMIHAPFQAGAVRAATLAAPIGAGAAAGLAAATWSPALVQAFRLHLAAHLGAAPPLDAWDLAAAAAWLPIAILIAASAAGLAARAGVRAIA